MNCMVAPAKVSRFKDTPYKLRQPQFEIAEPYFSPLRLQSHPASE
jgi:hypothetical protein